MINCIIIDDEPMAIELLEEYVEKCPFLQHSGSYRDAVKALDFLHSSQIDLIFLDINMPDLTGIQFLKALVDQPMVIFTTAYPEYAVESYDFAAVDYLLKPIEFDRFLKSVNKAQDLHNLKLTDQDINNTPESQTEFMMIKSGTDYYRVVIEEILYIESAGNYVNFITESGEIMSLMSMKSTLELLPRDKFIRIHKSYIVAVNKIMKIDHDSVYINKKEIPIGDVYRDNIKSIIG